MNSKHFISLFLLFLGGAAAQSSAQTFQIQGKLGKEKQGYIFLTYEDGNNKSHRDSAVVKNGVFTLKGTIAEPVYAVLDLNPMVVDMMDPNQPVPDQHDFFLAKDNISVNSAAGMKEATISGGKSQAEFSSLMGALKSIGERGKQLDTLYYAYRTEENEEGLKEIGTEYAELKKKRTDIQTQFVKNNPSSFVAFNIWKRKTVGMLDLAVIEPEFKGFSAEIISSPSGKELTRRISIAKSLDAGNVPPDFTLPDTSGKMVSLSSFKGKNVLLCFWFRNFTDFESYSFVMTRLNKQLRSENFEIVSVFYNQASENSEGWKKILKDNSMTWTNLFDENGIPREGAVSKIAIAYDLNNGRMPQGILIGPNGKIIKKINLAADPVAEIKPILVNN